MILCQVKQINLLLIDCNCLTFILYVVPVDLMLLRQPAGHIRVRDSLKLFCNITIRIQVPVITGNNIKVSITWTKMSQLPSNHDIITIDQFSTSNEVTESDGLYMYSSILLINSLTFSDSARYTCAATISPHHSSLNLFNVTKQSSTIDVLLSKCRPSFYCLIYHYVN